MRFLAEIPAETKQCDSVLSEYRTLRGVRRIRLQRGGHAIIPGEVIRWHEPSNEHS